MRLETNVYTDILVVIVIKFFFDKGSEKRSEREKIKRIEIVREREKEREREREIIINLFI
jgi:hypothetical protein